MEQPPNQCLLYYPVYDSQGATVPPVEKAEFLDAFFASALYRARIAVDLEPLRPEIKILAQLYNAYRLSLVPSVETNGVSYLISALHALVNVWTTVVLQVRTLKHSVPGEASAMQVAMELVQRYVRHVFASAFKVSIQEMFPDPNSDAPSQEAWNLVSKRYTDPTQRVDVRACVLAISRVLDHGVDALMDVHDVASVTTPYNFELAFDAVRDAGQLLLLAGQLDRLAKCGAFKQPDVSAQEVGDALAQLAAAETYILHYVGADALNFAMDTYRDETYHSMVRLLLGNLICANAEFVREIAGGAEATAAANRAARNKRRVFYEFLELVYHLSQILSHFDAETNRAVVQYFVTAGLDPCVDLDFTVPAEFAETDRLALRLLPDANHVLQRAVALTGAKPDAALEFVERLPAASDDSGPLVSAAVAVTPVAQFELRLDASLNDMFSRTAQMSVMYAEMIAALGGIAAVAAGAVLLKAVDALCNSATDVRNVRVAVVRGVEAAAIASNGMALLRDVVLQGCEDPATKMRFREMATRDLRTVRFHCQRAVLKLTQVRDLYAPIGRAAGHLPPGLVGLSDELVALCNNCIDGVKQHAAGLGLTNIGGEDPESALQLLYGLRASAFVRMVDLIGGAFLTSPFKNAWPVTLHEMATTATEGEHWTMMLRNLAASLRPDMLADRTPLAMASRGLALVKIGLQKLTEHRAQSPHSQALEGTVAKIGEAVEQLLQLSARESQMVAAYASQGRSQYEAKVQLQQERSRAWVVFAHHVETGVAQASLLSSEAMARDAMFVRRVVEGERKFPGPVQEPAETTDTAATFQHIKHLLDRCKNDIDVQVPVPSEREAVDKIAPAIVAWQEEEQQALRTIVAALGQRQPGAKDKLTELRSVHSLRENQIKADVDNVLSDVPQMLELKVAEYTRMVDDACFQWERNCARQLMHIAQGWDGSRTKTAIRDAAGTMYLKADQHVTASFAMVRETRAVAVETLSKIANEKQLEFDFLSQRVKKFTLNVYAENFFAALKPVLERFDLLEEPRQQQQQQRQQMETQEPEPEKKEPTLAGSGRRTTVHPMIRDIPPPMQQAPPATAPTPEPSQPPPPPQFGPQTQPVPLVQPVPQAAAQQPARPTTQSAPTTQPEPAASFGGFGIPAAAVAQVSRTSENVQELQPARPTTQPEQAASFGGFGVPAAAVAQVSRTSENVQELQTRLHECAAQMKRCSEAAQTAEQGSTPCERRLREAHDLVHEHETTIAKLQAAISKLEHESGDVRNRYTECSKKLREWQSKLDAEVEKVRREAYAECERLRATGLQQEQLSDVLEATAKKAHEAQAQLREKERQCKELRLKMSKLAASKSKETTDMQERLQQVAGELDASRRALQEAEARAAELGQQPVLLGNQLTAMQGELDQARDRIATKERQLAAVAKELSETAAARSKETADLEARLRLAAQELETCQEAVRVAENRATALGRRPTAEQLSAVHEQRLQAEEQVAIKERELAKAKKALAQAAASSAKEIAHLENRLRLATEEVAGCRATTQKTQTELAQRPTAEQLGAVQDQLKDALQIVGDKERQLATLQHEQQVQAAELRDRLRRVSEELEASRAEAKRAAARATELGQRPTAEQLGAMQRKLEEALQRVANKERELADLNAKLSETVAAKSEEAVHLAARLQTASREVAVAQAAVRDAEARAALLQQRAEQLAEVERRLGEALEQVASKERELARLQTERTQFAQSGEKLQAEVRRLSLELDASRAETQKAHARATELGRRPTEERVAEVHKQRIEAERQLEAKERELAKLKKVTAQTAAARTRETTDLEAKLRHATEDLGACEALVRKEQARTAELGKRPTAEELAEVRAQLEEAARHAANKERELAVLRQQMVSKSEQAVDLEARLQTATRELAELRAAAREAEGRVTKLGQRPTVQQLAAVQQHRDRALEQVANNERELARLKSELAEVADLEARLQAAQQELAHSREEVRLAASQRSGAPDERTAALQRQLSEASKQVTAKERELEELRQELGDVHTRADGELSEAAERYRETLEQLNGTRAAAEQAEARAAELATQLADAVAKQAEARAIDAKLRARLERLEDAREACLRERAQGEADASAQLEDQARARSSLQAEVADLERRLRDKEEEVRALAEKRDERAVVRARELEGAHRDLLAETGQLKKQLADHDAARERLENDLREVRQELQAATTARETHALTARRLQETSDELRESERVAEEARQEARALRAAQAAWAEQKRELDLRVREQEDLLQAEAARAEEMQRKQNANREKLTDAATRAEAELANCREQLAQATKARGELQALVDGLTAERDECRALLAAAQDAAVAAVRGSLPQQQQEQQEREVIAAREKLAVAEKKLRRAEQRKTDETRELEERLRVLTAEKEDAEARLLQASEAARQREQADAKRRAKLEEEALELAEKKARVESELQSLTNRLETETNAFEERCQERARAIEAERARLETEREEARTRLAEMEQREAESVRLQGLLTAEETRCAVLDTELRELRDRAERDAGDCEELRRKYEFAMRLYAVVVEQRARAKAAFPPDEPGNDERWIEAVSAAAIAAAREAAEKRAVAATGPQTLQTLRDELSAARFEADWLREVERKQKVQLRVAYRVLDPYQAPRRRGELDPVAGEGLPEMLARILRAARGEGGGDAPSERFLAELQEAMSADLQPIGEDELQVERDRVAMLEQRVRMLELENDVVREAAQNAENAVVQCVQQRSSELRTVATALREARARLRDVEALTAPGATAEDAAQFERVAEQQLGALLRTRRTDERWRDAADALRLAVRARLVLASRPLEGEEEEEEELSSQRVDGELTRQLESPRGRARDVLLLWALHERLLDSVASTERYVEVTSSLDARRATVAWLWLQYAAQVAGRREGDADATAEEVVESVKQAAALGVRVTRARRRARRQARLGGPGAAALGAGESRQRRLEAAAQVERDFVDILDQLREQFPNLNVGLPDILQPRLRKLAREYAAHQDALLLLRDAAPDASGGGDDEESREALGRLRSRVRELESRAADMQGIYCEAPTSEAVASAVHTVHGVAETCRSRAAAADAHAVLVEQKLQRVQDNLMRKNMEVAKAHSVLRNCKSRKASLQGLLSLVRGRNAVLEESLETLRREKAALATQLRACHERLDTSLSSAEQQQLSRDRENELTETERALAETTKALRQIEERARHLEEELEGLRDRAAETRAVESAYRLRQTSLEKRAHAAEQQLQALQARHEEQRVRHEEESAKQRAAAAALQNRVHLLEAEMDGYREAAQMAHETQHYAAELERRLARSENDAAARSELERGLRAETVQLQQTNERLEGSLQEGKRRWRELVAERDRVLAEKRGARAKVGARLRELSGQLERCRRSNRTLARQLMDSTARLDATGAAARQLRQRRQQGPQHLAPGETRRLREELARFNAQLSAAAAKGDACADLHVLRRSLNALLDRAYALNAKLAKETRQQHRGEREDKQERRETARLRAELESKARALSELQRAHAERLANLGDAERLVTELHESLREQAARDAARASDENATTAAAVREYAEAVSRDTAALRSAMDTWLSRQSTSAGKAAATALREIAGEWAQQHALVGDVLARAVSAQGEAHAMGYAARAQLLDLTDQAFVRLVAEREDAFREVRREYEESVAAIRADYALRLEMGARSMVERLHEVREQLRALPLLQEGGEDVLARARAAVREAAPRLQPGEMFEKAFSDAERKHEEAVAELLEQHRRELEARRELGGASGSGGGGARGSMPIAVLLNAEQIEQLVRKHDAAAKTMLEQAMELRNLHAAHYDRQAKTLLDALECASPARGEENAADALIARMTEQLKADKAAVEEAWASNLAPIVNMLKHILKQPARQWKTDFENLLAALENATPAYQDWSMDESPGLRTDDEDNEEEEEEGYQTPLEDVEEEDPPKREEPPRRRLRRELAAAREEAAERVRVAEEAERRLREELDAAREEQEERTREALRRVRQLEESERQLQQVLDETVRANEARDRETAERARELQESKRQLQRDLATARKELAAERERATDRVRRLEESEQRLQRDLDTARRELEARAGEALQRVRELEDAEARLREDLVKALESEERAQRELGESREQLQRELDTERKRAAERVRQLEDSERQLQRELGAERGRTAECVRQLEDSEQQLQRELEAERERAAERTRQLEDSEQQLQRELEAERERAAERTRQLEASEQQLHADLSAARRDLQARGRELVERVEELEASRLQLQRDLAEARTDRDARERQATERLRELEESKRQLQQDLNAARKEAQAREGPPASDERVRQLQETEYRLREDLNAAREELAAASARGGESESHLRAELAAAQARVAELQERATAHRDEALEAKRTAAEAAEGVREAEERAARSEHQLRQVLDRTQQLEQDYDAVRAELEANEQRVIALSEAADKSKALVGEIIASMRSGSAAITEDTVVDAVVAMVAFLEQMLVLQQKLTALTDVSDLDPGALEGVDRTQLLEMEVAILRDQVLKHTHPESGNAVGALDEMLGMLDKMRDSVGAQLEAHVARADELDRRCRALERELTTRKQELGETQSQLHETQDEVFDLQDKLKDVINHANAVSEQYAATLRRLAEMQTNTNALQYALDARDTELTRSKRDLEGALAEARSLKRQYDELLLASTEEEEEELVRRRRRHSSPHRPPRDPLLRRDPTAEKLALDQRRLAALQHLVTARESEARALAVEAAAAAQEARYAELSLELRAKADGLLRTKRKDYETLIAMKTSLLRERKDRALEAMTRANAAAGGDREQYRAAHERYKDELVETQRELAALRNTMERTLSDTHAALAQQIEDLDVERAQAVAETRIRVAAELEGSGEPGQGEGEDEAVLATLTVVRASTETMGDVQKRVRRALAEIDRRAAETDALSARLRLARESSRLLDEFASLAPEVSNSAALFDKAEWARQVLVRTVAEEADKVSVPRQARVLLGSLRDALERLSPEQLGGFPGDRAALERAVLAVAEETGLRGGGRRWGDETADKLDRLLKGVDSLRQSALSPDETPEEEEPAVQEPEEKEEEELDRADEEKPAYQALRERVRLLRRQLELARAATLRQRRFLIDSFLQEVTEAGLQLVRREMGDAGRVAEEMAARLMRPTLESFRDWYLDRLDAIDRRVAERLTADADAQAVRYERAMARVRAEFSNKLRVARAQTAAAVSALRARTQRLRQVEDRHGRLALLVVKLQARLKRVTAAKRTAERQRDDVAERLRQVTAEKEELASRYEAERRRCAEQQREARAAVERLQAEVRELREQLAQALAAEAEAMRKAERALARATEAETRGVYEKDREMQYLLKTTHLERLARRRLQDELAYVAGARPLPASAIQYVDRVPFLEGYDDGNDPHYLELKRVLREYGAQPRGKTE